VAATRPERAGDAELAAPLGCEQDEDQEDQQDPRGDRERAELREERDEERSGAVRRVQRVLLGLVGFEAERAHRWVQRFDDLVGRGDAATVGNVDPVDQARFVQQRLRTRQRHQHSVVGGRRTLVIDHRADAGCLEASAGEDADRVPGLRAERVGELRVQEDLVRPELRERHRPAGCAHCAERAQRGRIARKSVTFGSYCFRLTSWTALPQMSTGATARTSLEARPAAATCPASLCGK
jgi:hypothetical protein